jgi:hypothetical protein
MIIKFQSKNRWVYFGDVDQCEHEVLGNAGCSAYDESVSVYQPPPGERPAERFVELVFSQGKPEGRIVYAYSPIYLMNNEGKTIDVI